MKKLSLVVFSLFILLLSSEAFCCTSGIFTGKVTADGRPLLWKHRDTGELDNRIEYFKGEIYSFLGLVNSSSKGGEVWGGTNSEGFSIINTASYNLKEKGDKTSDKYMDREGVVMYKALGRCKTLKDFEEFLTEYKTPIGVEANFGVIDAEGGAAYYEVNNSKWTKVDVNDPKIAPQGYIVYTNYSYTGRIDEGMGYIRYTTADNTIKKRIGCGFKITPEWIYSSLSRSFYNSALDIDLRKENFIKNGNGFFIDQDFIPRKSSASSIVIQGIKMGESPLNTVMWAILGYPPVSVAVPLFVKAAENQPAFMIKSNNSNNALMCDMALNVKNTKVFTIQRGNGSKYFNFGFLYNGKGKGFMEKIEKIEKEVFEVSNQFIEENRNKPYNKENYNSLYDNIFKIIKRGYVSF
jgi:hypothetical protein